MEGFIQKLHEKENTLYKNQWASIEMLKAYGFLKKEQYSKSLESLLILTKGQPSLKLSFETIQRVYAHRQMGQGKVGLQRL